MPAVLCLPEPDRLLCLKESRPARNPFCFQAWGDCQTDRLIAAGFIRHQQICSQRIQPAADALHGGIEALHVDGNIAGHNAPLLLPEYSLFLCKDRMPVNRSIALQNQNILQIDL